MEIRPQEGKQTDFLSTNADIAIYGGAAGGGKTFGLLLECLRHIDNKGFGAVIFRRDSKQIKNEGSLLDNSSELYPLVGGECTSYPMPTWTFRSGAKISFSHLNLEKDKYSWQGSQICLIAFDELTHFTASQFWYMLSRNRSTCGIRPYIRATCNPDADSWVRRLIDWWIDKEGYAIPERSGVLRYFFRDSGEIIWGDSKEELQKKHNCNAEDIKSLTFISSNVYDNKILMEKDPSYIANLKALTLVDRQRLLNGNWNIKPQAGLIFRRSQVNVIETLPNDIKRWCRAWDLGATEVSSDNPSPDATAGVLIGVRDNGRYVVANVVRVCEQAADVRRLIKNMCVSDKANYKQVLVKLPQDPGQAGKAQAADFVKYLAGYKVKTQIVSGDKVTRSEPFAAQWQAGNVDVLAGDWNEAYFNELEQFPEGLHDDMVDASSDAFVGLMESRNPITFNPANLRR